MHRLEKSTPPPFVAGATNLSYVHDGHGGCSGLCIHGETFSPKSDGDDATGCDDRVEGGAVGGGGGNQGGIDKTVLPRPPALQNLHCS